MLLQRLVFTCETKRTE